MTMIEVMVVLGIMAVLAAMVVPVFRALQLRHQAGACAYNLKNIGQALLMYRADNMGFPPDAKEWWDQSKGLHGLGLSQLYYGYWVHDQATPGEYVMPPSNYLRDVRMLHCPRAPADAPDYTDWPYLGGYNVYDWNYRRDRWHHSDLTQNTWGAEQGLRNLKQPFPPDNTVVTWCPRHRDTPPPDETTLGGIRAGDHDLVLWADGSVSNFVTTPSRDDQYKAEQPR
jgi:type II secretory pathway pseudopilin PulG